MSTRATRPWRRADVPQAPHRPLPAGIAYRNLFGGVFAEAHLFERLYGLDADAQARAPELIAAMGLEGKVSFADGRFSIVDLSTGQRKRLALIGALLEDRDVLVFDEWAADQDQHFRRIFYEEILGDLRRRGKTIFAITHDERFWGLADRLFRFENGEMVELDPARYAEPSAARLETVAGIRSVTEAPAS